MAMVNFKKGTLANLPAAKSEGTFYVTTDERALYLDVDGSTRIRIGDFQEFATLTALQANTNPSTTALYYVTELNCLAKWDGSKYVQINLDTGATRVEGVGDGNAVTAASYDAATRKLTLTAGATYATPGDVDTKIATKVGEIGDKTVKAYVDDKTSGIASDEALNTLSGRVDTLEGDKTVNGSVDKKIDDAIKALDVEAVTAGTGEVISEVSETDGKVSVTKKTLTAEDIPTLTTAKLSDFASEMAKKQDVVAFEGAYDKDTNKAATMADVTDAVAGLSGAMHFKGTETALPTDVSAYASGDVIIVGNKEYVFDGTSFKELGDESVYAVKGSIVNSDIADNAAIAQSKIAGLTDALAGKADADDLHTHGNKEELDKIATGDKAKWDAAEQNAKTYADGLMTWGTF